MKSASLADHLTRVGRRTISALLQTPPPLLLAGLGCVALAASSDVANTFDAPRRGGPLPAVLLCLTLALAFACFLLALRPLPSWLARRWSLLRLLVFPLLFWALFTATQTSVILARGMATALTTSHVRYGSDDLYDNHYNAWLVLHGQNPYLGERLAAVVAYFGERSYTPLQRGRFANPRHYPTVAELDVVLDGYLADPHVPPPELDPRTTHSYPAGAFLVNLPAVWAGVPSIAAEQILLFMALVAAIIVLAPSRWWLLVALLLLATADGARQVTGGDFEIWPLACIAGAWLLRERRWPSALLLGAACAIKQTAWLAAPFYLLWVWRAYGRAEAGRRAGLAVGCFLLINLPWIVASPREWLAGIFLPISLPLLPDGSGIVGLSLTGVLPLAPSWVYSAFELAALAGALAWYWREQSGMPFAGLLLPLLPLFFAWRSSERYFVLLPLLALLAVVLALRAAAPQSPAMQAGGSSTMEAHGE
jgi:uncharacterized membrane protein